MRPTSLESWKHILPSLPQRRREALRLVLEFQGRTAAELESLAGGCGIASARHVNKRLSELERQGLVVASGMGEALCWYPAAEAPSEPRPLSRPIPRKQLEHVYAVAREFVDAMVAGAPTSTRNLREAVRAVEP